ncbi:MAG: tRNA dihydrouridine synthase DusB [Candidatus Sumerlaeia bacterium]
MLHPREQYRRYLQKCPILPAPMCGYSDRPFRELLRMMQAYTVVTEMYSSEAMVRGDPKTWRLMDFQKETAPVVVQIFGSRPDLMAETARIVVREGAHVVDLNMGCPVKKIIKTGSGAALAENFENARRIIRGIRKAVPYVPFTIKIRWQADGGALAIGRMAEDEGVDAIAIHGRTRAQGYSGAANWDWIARLKQAVSIPVIGNGDIRSAEDARRMFEQAGCDGVMIGRGLVGYPWLMAEAVHYWKSGWTEQLAPPDDNDRLRLLLAHAQYMRDYRGRKGMIEFRKHCAMYTKGMPNARQARPDLMQVETMDQLREQLQKHFGPLPEA